MNDDFEGLPMCNCMEWRSIGTAPKDGTPLLLFAYANDATARTRVVGWWLFGSDDQEGWINATFLGQGDPAKLRPTHWMPLPDFPMELHS